MNTINADIRSGTCCVKYEISDLPVENSGRIKSQTSPRISCIARLVLITVNQRERREIRSGFNSRYIVRITYHLRIIVVNNWRRYPVYSAGEVDDSGACCRGLA